MSDAALAGVPGDGKPVKEKIHLLYLIGEVGLGGSEHQLYLLLKHLDKTLFDLHVLVFNPSPYGMLDQDMCRLGAHVYQMPEECRRVSSRFRFILHLARKISPHIIHSWSLHDNPYAGLAGWLAGVPGIAAQFVESFERAKPASLVPLAIAVQRCWPGGEFICCSSRTAVCGNDPTAFVFAAKLCRTVGRASTRASQAAPDRYGRQSAIR